ncbi:MAG: 2-oxoglutarate dehydrogenase E1 component, partial [Proteobacteria bacterium]|nr:2-oxoglutarate dehydrogenase E1 component [Pseudomonadota bacterium]
DWHPILDELIKSYPFIESKPGWGMTYIDDDSKEPRTNTPPPSHEKEKAPVSEKSLKDTIKAFFLVEAYRKHGHISADLDPLNATQKRGHESLDPKFFGFTDADFAHPIFVNGLFGKDYMTLSDLVFELQKTYCAKIAVEYSHLSNEKEKNWFKNKFESPAPSYSNEQKKWILENLTKAEFFEKTIHVKFPGAKRFGLDGGESLIPGLLHFMNKKAKTSVQEFIFGMPHRGRLSILCNILKKSYRSIFAQFEGMSPIPLDIDASSDVKYHLGHSSDVLLNGKEVHLTMLPNPSHLEAVNPIVLGKVRAAQNHIKDTKRAQVLGILLHGDAAFAGQGIVSETLLLSKLDGYKTGGILHVVVNNQIGFTTFPEYSRASTHSTDIAKAVDAPILHVNGDDPEAVLQAFEIAADYHSEFASDIVIDFVCYRRFGHNEGDEPVFTQPKMYTFIKNHTTVRAHYEELLERKGVLTKDETQIIRDNISLKLQEEYEAAQKIKAANQSAEPKADWMEGEWKSIKSELSPQNIQESVKTGVDVAILRALGLKSLTPPESFNLNSKIIRQWEQKRNVLNTGQGVDWALAESLAFATSLLEGHNVRLSGQDSERGTFSQRHAIITDQENEKPYLSLNHLQSGQAKCEIINSPLSEFGVLGFEYGYSLKAPNDMVLWEAQFGDFANGAQVMFDQFISSSQMKWLRLSGLIVLLPHGFEGQGPEHSSARLERYLQLCAQNNMIVANCSTPANYFHILRRQVKAKYRKPLILMTPKSLLRHTLCVSSLKEMGSNTTFSTVISDALPTPKIKKIVLCSGKVYYDLLEARQKENIESVALIRLEQFYPFPDDALLETLKVYPKVPVVWCQEEPENMGAWHFLDRRLESVLTKWSGELMRPLYVGRPASASPAVGLLSTHKLEQEQLIKAALHV